MAPRTRTPPSRSSPLPPVALAGLMLFIPAAASAAMAASARAESTELSADEPPPAIELNSEVGAEDRGQPLEDDERMTPSWLRTSAGLATGGAAAVVLEAGIAASATGSYFLATSVMPVGSAPVEGWVAAAVLTMAGVPFIALPLAAVTAGLVAYVLGGQEAGIAAAKIVPVGFAVGVFKANLIGLTGTMLATTAVVTYGVVNGFSPVEGYNPLFVTLVGGAGGVLSAVSSAVVGVPLAVGLVAGAAAYSKAVASPLSE